MSASRINSFGAIRWLIAIAASLIALTATASAATTPTATPTPISGAISDNSFGTGFLEESSIPGTSEPAQTDVEGFFLMSVVAIQGIGSTHSTNASSAFICLPNTPGPWISIGDWACNGGGANQVHVAAAYRFTDENDAPGK